MYTLKIKNAKNETYELSHNTHKYIITGVDGLTPPKFNINTSTGGVLDGEFFNSARAGARNIVITLELEGNIEQNRAEIYRIFTLKKPCTLYFKNVNRDVKIECYVEAIESDLFVQREKMQISLLCPRAYFEDAEEMIVELASVYNKFEFAFTIEEPISIAEISDTPVSIVNNTGEIETGAVFTVRVLSSMMGFTIVNDTTGESFGISLVFVSGDIVTINTIPGQKSAILQRGEFTLNLINYINDGSKWLTVALGENAFTYYTTSDVSAIELTISSNRLYGGV